jgi:hypothetical protein
MRRSVTAALLLSLVMLPAFARADEAWTPTAWRNVDILEILTTGPEEGEHWSKLWLVVLDGQIYLRLGTRAAERVQSNVKKPFVQVRISGQQFDRVRAEEAPDFRDRVANAMAEKYWSDRLIRLMSHPMTVRLVPEDSAP